MCKYGRKCKYGSKCRFAHFKEELIQPRGAKCVKSAEPPEAPPTPEPPQPTPAPPVEHPDEKLCVICLERPRTHITTGGCFHKVVCGVCCSRLYKCPMCNRPTSFHVVYE